MSTFDSSSGYGPVGFADPRLNIFHSLLSIFGEETLSEFGKIFFELTPVGLKLLSILDVNPMCFLDHFEGVSEEPKNLIANGCSKRSYLHAVIDGADPEAIPFPDSKCCSNQSAHCHLSILLLMLYHFKVKKLAAADAIPLPEQYKHLDWPEGTDDNTRALSYFCAYCAYSCPLCFGKDATYEPVECTLYQQNKCYCLQGADKSFPEKEVVAHCARLWYRTAVNEVGQNPMLVPEAPTTKQ